MPKTQDVQKLIDDTDALLGRMAELGIEAANVATALTSRGAPAAETFLQELAELGRLFAALRSEAFAVASCLPVPLPPLDAVSSAADLKAMLGALCVTVEAAERQAEVVAARESALNILGRVSVLAHVDHAAFEPLQLCQEQASALRSALEQRTGEADVHRLGSRARRREMECAARQRHRCVWRITGDGRRARPPRPGSTQSPVTGSNSIPTPPGVSTL